MLTKKELEHAEKILGRTPNPIERAMLDNLWAEFCSYKSSKRWFHLFKLDGERVVSTAVEGQMGLVDIGDNMILGVTIESRNHAANAEPFHGAATGIGEVIRDILSIGCKPIGLMNCLHFGPLTNVNEINKLRQTVRGISFYGNSVGIPMIGGETEFDKSYTGNCVVNLVGLGIVESNRVMRKKEMQAGYELVIFGAETTSDLTIPGTEEDIQGFVQMGDPLTKKLLLDALEVILDREILEGLQDIGSGGLAAAIGHLLTGKDNGIEIHLDKIHTSGNCAARDILTSRSQERMICVVSPEKRESLLSIFEGFEIQASAIGTITDDGNFTAFMKGDIVAKIPLKILIEGFPEPSRIEVENILGDVPLSWVNSKIDHKSTIMDMMTSLNLCNRQWISSQYDQHIQLNTVIDIGENAGVLEISDKKLLAFTTDCNSNWCLLDPWTGTANSAAESLRNLVACGAEPIFIADCLNFGNPEKPESYGEYVDAFRGLGEFSSDFNLPIIGGSVSLYNEKQIEKIRTKINPTPQIIMGGLFTNGRKPVRRNLVTPWANIFLIGKTHKELNGTEFQELQLGERKGLPPRYLPGDEKRSMQVILEANQAGIIRSCNNLGRGGLAAALIKMVVNSEYGFTITLDDVPGTATTSTEILYSETPARYLVEVTESNQPQFLGITEKHDVSVVELGLTQKNQMADFGSFSLDIQRLIHSYKTILEELIE